VRPNGIVNATTALALPVPDISLRLRRPERGQDKALALALAVALVLHLAALAWLYEQPQPAPQPGVSSDAIAVEILPPSELPRAARTPTPTRPDTPRPVTPDAVPPAPPPAVAPAPSQATRPPPPEPEMIRPTTMLSARNLAGAGSRQARLALRTLTDDTRAEQLCGLEAMEQVHAWRRDFQPDRLVAYAMGEPKPIANGIEADGAAFRSRSNWYRIRFRCELSPDRGRVAAFAFAVGDPVPRDEWEEHGLPAVH
jgi:type IV secretory pathway VirB10-like protein